MIKTYNQSNSDFLKTYNTELAEIIIIFTDQNSRPSEKEKKIILRYLLINRKDTLFELSSATIFYKTKDKKIH